MNSFQSGKNINQGYYKSFEPNLINKAWQITDMQIFVLLSKVFLSSERLVLLADMPML